MRPLAIFSKLFAVCALVVAVLVGCGTMPEAPAVPDRTAPTTMRLTVSYIDVGKGDCILIEAAGESALIDTGYETTSNDVLSYLRARGVNQLQRVIITHYDRDHVGGLRAIAEALPVEEVCLPNYEGADKNYQTVTDAIGSLDLSAHQVTKEEVLQLGDATLTIIPTSLTYEKGQGNGEGNDNDLSLVVTLTNRDDSYLFAGDLEKKGIDAYLDDPRGTFDVLKMPHHGEWCGKTDELVEDMSPRIAIITDGEDDPAEKKTLEHLEDARIDTYRTSTDGTIVVESHGLADYTVTTQR